MKVKTSITLSEDLLEELDRVAGPESRSSLIERIVRSHLVRLAREQRDARDRRLLDEHAEALNREALDVLKYQASGLDPDD